MTTYLSDSECKIVEKWQRQYRNRRRVYVMLAIGVVSVIAPGLVLLFRVFVFLDRRGVSYLDALRFNWTDHLEPATTSQLLYCLTLGAMMIVTPAAIVAVLFVSLRVDSARYRVVEKLMRGAGFHARKRAE